MRNYIIVILLFLAFKMNSQNTFPILHTNSMELDFEDGLKFYEKGWTIDPSIKLDVYESTYYDEDHEVTFYSEKESISFKVNDAPHFDFAIVYNNKDTCYTRVKGIKSQTPEKYNKYKQKTIKSTKDTIPFVVGDNHMIYFKMGVNGSKELKFLFDTGANAVIIDDALVESKIVKLKIDTIITNQGSDGLNKMKKSVNNKLETQNLIWNNFNVYTKAFTHTNYNGVGGWNLFVDKIVEINYSKQLMILHEALPQDFTDYSKLKMRHINGLHYIDLCLVIKGEEYCGWFEYDTGFRRTLNVNKKFTDKYNLSATMESIGESTTSGTAGHKIKVNRVLVPELQIGDYEAYRIPISLVEKVKQGIDHNGLLGNEIMKRFDVIIDYKKNELYLKPNDYWYLPYGK